MKIWISKVISDYFDVVEVVLLLCTKFGSYLVAAGEGGKWGVDAGWLYDLKSTSLIVYVENQVVIQRLTFLK